MCLHRGVEYCSTKRTAACRDKPGQYHDVWTLSTEPRETVSHSCSPQRPRCLPSSACRVQLRPAAGMRPPHRRQQPCRATSAAWRERGTESPTRARSGPTTAQPVDDDDDQQRTTPLKEAIFKNNLARDSYWTSTCMMHLQEICEP
jgi:hypothetical protein